MALIEADHLIPRYKITYRVQVTPHDHPMCFVQPFKMFCLPVDRRRTRPAHCFSVACCPIDGCTSGNTELKPVPSAGREFEAAFPRKDIAYGALIQLVGIQGLLRIHSANVGLQSTTPRACWTLERPQLTVSTFVRARRLNASMPRETRRRRTEKTTPARPCLIS